MSSFRIAQMSVLELLRSNNFLQICQIHRRVWLRETDSVAIQHKMGFCPNQRTSVTDGSHLSSLEPPSNGAFQTVGVYLVIITIVVRIMTGNSSWLLTWMNWTTLLMLSWVSQNFKEEKMLMHILNGRSNVIRFLEYIYWPRHINFASVEFSGYVLIWWNWLQENQVELGRDHIRTLVEMKIVSRRRFVSSTHQRDLHNKLQHWYKATNPFIILRKWSCFWSRWRKKMTSFLHGLNFLMLQPAGRWPRSCPWSEPPLLATSPNLTSRGYHGHRPATSLRSRCNR